MLCFIIQIAFFLYVPLKGESMNVISKSAGLVLMLILLLCGSAYSDELASFDHLTGEINIAGGTAHLPVMQDAARQIMTRNPQILITVAGGGSGVGIQKVGEGLVDIGNAGRPVSKKELTKYTELVSFPFAVDGVAVVLHPSNRIADLTRSQIQDIFSGQITNWQQLGGDNRSINIYSRDEASGTRAVFWKKCLAKGQVVDSANIVPSNGAMKMAISNDANAIGYVSIGHIDRSVKAPLYNGVAATQENAINGSYTVVRKLYMNTNGQPTPLVQAFISYILGDESAVSIERHGYIPMN